MALVALLENEFVEMARRHGVQVVRENVSSLARNHMRETTPGGQQGRACAPCSVDGGSRCCTRRWITAWNW
jgi:hypothetical protein